jgi:hypothetical protein
VNFAYNTSCQKVLVGKLSFGEVTALTSAGLLVEPGMGQVGLCSKTEDGNWLLQLGEYALVFSDDVEIPPVTLESLTDPLPPILFHHEKMVPAIPGSSSVGYRKSRGRCFVWSAYVVMMKQPGISSAR